MTKLQQSIIRDEGDQPSVYQDNLGYWTLGIGFLVDARKGGVLPPEVRDFWFNYIIGDREDALRAALPWFATLDEARQGVLLNMAYQLGSEGVLKFTDTLAKVRDGRYADAANAMLQSDWAKQTPKRAKRLSDQMESGQWQ